MSPKMGRPPKQEQPRNKKLNLRLTEQELQDINECSDKLGMSRTDTIMKGIEIIKADLDK